MQWSASKQGPVWSSWEDHLPSGFNSQETCGVFNDQNDNRKELSEAQLGILAFLPTRLTPQNKTRLTPQNKTRPTPQNKTRPTPQNIKARKNKLPAVTDCMAPGLNIEFAIVAQAVPLKHLNIQPIYNCTSVIIQ